MTHFHQFSEWLPKARRGLEECVDDVKNHKNARLATTEGACDAFAKGMLTACEKWVVDYREGDHIYCYSEAGKNSEKCFVDFDGTESWRVYSQIMTKRGVARAMTRNIYWLQKIRQNLHVCGVVRCAQRSRHMTTDKFCGFWGTQWKNECGVNRILKDHIDWDSNAWEAAENQLTGLKDLLTDW